MQANTKQAMFKVSAMFARSWPPLMSLSMNLFLTEMEQIKAGTQKINDGRKMTKLKTDHLSKKGKHHLKINN